MADIDKLTKRFITQSLIITAVLWIIGFVVTQFVPAADSQLALLVSAVSRLSLLLLMDCCGALRLKRVLKP